MDSEKERHTEKDSERQREKETKCAFYFSGFSSMRNMPMFVKLRN